MVTDQQVCPACGRPVGTVVRRRKTLGAYVPDYRRAPCHNPDCPANKGGSTRSDRPRRVPRTSETPGAGER